MANDTQPYLISESRLKQTSEYFANAIKHENWGVAQDGKLNFPDDDKNAFELMLYYIVEGSLPNSLNTAAVATQKVMIETWAIADKYLIRDLQDLIMVTLLFQFDNQELDWEVVRCAFERTGEGSKMRRLIAEEAMCRTFTGESFMNSDSAEVKELEKAISGIEGALCEVMAMREEYSHRSDLGCRLESHETTRPYLYGSFEPESRACCYLEILHRLRC